MTRLHAFCSMKNGNFRTFGDIEDDIDHVVDLLTKRDLLVFAASTRNFAEAAESVDDMRTTFVATCTLLLPPAPPFFIEDSSSITLCQALSRIIHSNELRICRAANDYEFLLASSSDEFIRMVVRRHGKEAERSETLVMVRTERDPVTFLQLRSLLSSACDFMNKVSDHLSENDKIFLQREYR
jgi:hypothetical protein